jgi:hypothetical protein
MKLNRSFGAAFHRAATFFPSPVLTLECGQSSQKPDAFCAVSCDPPIVAVTLPAGASAPTREFSISAAPVKFDCAALETQEIGDHIVIFAAVQRMEIRRGPAPPVSWRRASFQLRLDYPFLESAAALEDFVNAWLTGVLPKSAWTHAAHVAVTGCFAFENAREIVFTEMKRGILHFNAATGVVNGPDSGYHETLTRFWSDMITRSIRENKPQSRLDAASCAVRLFGEDRDLPALFYSFDVVRNRRARSEWLPPDQEPLPEWCGI